MIRMPLYFRHLVSILWFSLFWWFWLHGWLWLSLFRFCEALARGVQKSQAAATKQARQSWGFDSLLALVCVEGILWQAFLSTKPLVISLCNWHMEQLRYSDWRRRFSLIFSCLPHCFSFWLAFCGIPYTCKVIHLPLVAGYKWFEKHMDLGCPLIISQKSLENRLSHKEKKIYINIHICIICNYIHTI